MSQAMDLGADRAVRAVLIVVADVALLASVLCKFYFCQFFSVCRCHALRARRPLHS
jgi:hypothetical protein